MLALMLFFVVLFCFFSSIAFTDLLLPVIIEGELAISIMEVFDFLNLERRFSVSCSGLSEIRGGSDGLGFSDVSGVDDEVSQRTSTSDGAVSSSLPSNIDSNSMVGVADPLNTE